MGSLRSQECGMLMTQIVTRLASVHATCWPELDPDLVEVHIFLHKKKVQGFVEAGITNMAKDRQLGTSWTVTNPHFKQLQTNQITS